MADKRRVRQGGRGGNYTPQQAKDVLAIPVYAVIIGSAHPTFPTSNLASPSGLVAIVRNSGQCALTVGGKGLTLPCWINGRQWHRAVLPVLQDERWNPNNPAFKFMALTNVTVLVNAIGEALAQSFHEAGYGPIDK